MILKNYLPLFLLFIFTTNSNFGQSDPNLTVVKNLNANGQKETVEAAFAAEDTLVITGTPVKFFNLSTGNPTFQQWNFEGATPSVSYSPSPVIQYSFSGIYDVKLTVSGLNGSDTLLKKDYIRVIPEQSGLPPGWDYNPSITQHTVVVTYESNPRIFEDPLQPGDYIGLFYHDDNEELKCAGAVEWTGVGNTAVVAQGDNPFTPEKDGFDTGEELTWMLYSWEKADQFQAMPAYDPGMPLSVFVPNGISVILDLSAGNLAEVEFPEGWSGISSNILPWNGNLEELFAGYLDDIEMIYDGTHFFRPDEGLNTIGNWENRGYIVKMKNPEIIEFKGYPVDNLSVSLEAGWNILHVPVSCETSIAELMQGSIQHLKLIRDIAGQNIFWPAYSINTLQTLVPGKAYMLYANDPFAIQFAPCE